MNKLIKICVIIIALGLVINMFLYISKAKNSSQENNNISINKTSNQNNQESNASETEKYKNYYNISRTKLDRPIGYMINNIEDAWPQSGLYGADYIYEMMVEGGLTRLFAIYTRGDIDKIGPIRSARHNFLDISMEYDAVYAYFGGSPKAFSDIKSLNIPGLNGLQLDGYMYWRDSSRKAPHNSYTNIEKTLKYIKKYKYDKDVEDNHFKFDDSKKNLNGIDAKDIKINYSYSQNRSYTYDEESKLYKRFMKNKPHMDALINTQLTAKNIIVQFAEHSSIDDQNRQEIKLVGSGKGYYITNGKYVNITWKKDSRNAKTIYYDQKGEELLLNKGQTWIQIVPTNAKINIQ